MTEPAHLLPCPFCGGPATTSMAVMSDVEWHAWCNACDFVDMLRPTEAEAIAAWNRRSLATPDLDPNELRQLASQIYECAIAWEPEARLLGNVQAVDVARVAMFALNALADEVEP